jgi:hypothetical protein
LTLIAQGAAIIACQLKQIPQLASDDSLKEKVDAMLRTQQQLLSNEQELRIKTLL